MRILTATASVELIDAGDRIVQHINQKQLPFEPRTLDAWCETVKPGTVAIDVGAYSGLFSLLAASIGAYAIAVEPLPVMQARIIENANLNGLELRLVQAAASDADDKAQLAYTDVPFTAGASLVRKSAPNKITVKTVRLDSLKAPMGMPVAAVKIDVERGELAVLRGAAGLLNLHRPVLFVEVLDDAALAGVLELLPAYAFNGQRLDERNVILTPR